MSSLFYRMAAPIIIRLATFGFLGAINRLFPHTLTVLNYHRINDPYRSGFDVFLPNISATPGQFELQMEYMKKNYNLVNLNDLVLHIANKKKLPPCAALITFDDGYLDNYSNAFPILKKKNIPAVIFLTAGFMETQTPFYWDYIAYCFHHTRKSSATFPLIGEVSWKDMVSRNLVMMKLIEGIKKIPDLEKKGTVEKIATCLDVKPPLDAFKDMYLTWDQIRAMDESGLVEFGSHTVNHPILTRIPPEVVFDEIHESKTRIEKEIGKPVISLAYPNGGLNDYSDRVMEIANQSGIKLAFSLLPGPTSQTAVFKQPLAIRRIFLIHTDDFSRFVLKVSGVVRLRELFAEPG